jgi:uncharacterized integral membrane protein
VTDLIARIRQTLANIRTAGMLVALIMFIILLLQNTQSIPVHFLLAEFDIPSVILILVTSLGGFAIGYIVGFRRRKRVASQGRVSNARSADEPPAAPSEPS